MGDPKAAIARQLATHGALPPAPDGPALPRFDAHAVAVALEQELQRAARHGWTRITVHLDLPDARALALALRTAARRGA